MSLELNKIWAVYKVVFVVVVVVGDKKQEKRMTKFCKANLT
jgi:hypothetical protein